MTLGEPLYKRVDDSMPIRKPLHARVLPRSVMFQQDSFERGVPHVDCLTCLRGVLMTLH